MFKAYPAIFHFEDGGYWAEFPDLPGCQTEGDTIAEVVAEAANALGAHLCSMLDRSLALPEPSDIRSLTAEGCDFLSVISADPMLFQKRTRAVKKTLTIPEWLNDEAEKRNINFSSVLQQALINRLQ